MTFKRAFHIAIFLTVIGFVAFCGSQIIKTSKYISEKDRVIEPVFLAAQRGDLEFFQELKRKGRNLNPINRFGLTPFHVAAESNQAAVVNFLLKNGVAVDLKTLERETPLFIAVAKENFEVAKILLESGADVNVSARTSVSASKITIIELVQFSKDKRLIDLVTKYSNKK